MVTTAGQLVGLLYLDSHRPAVFSRLQRQTLEALAREVASVLDNARLLKKERERQRIEQELDIAREIQRSCSRAASINSPTCRSAASTGPVSPSAVITSI